eukprot:m.322018 g.322018  ORF g.322018 m.322018 type:complete len:992 (+) comp20344_c1_seq1:243-3218(+)
MFAKFQEAFAGKKRKTLSLGQLKALHTLMESNLVVTPENRNLIVESLRSISEIVIWGDQNDPKVFEFFLEKNMISYFDRILFQDAGVFINTQILQTLNILLDNISTPTSIWFLLSNNQMNSIITHKFDFNEEEVLAYYISFLKALAMRLNSDSLLFFHNEHLPNFPLYSEAIKFFNHKESMVRVAVRTLTLRVFKAAIHNDYTAQFLAKKAVPQYFSNLVWVAGNLSISMDRCLRYEATFTNKGRLEYFMAEHLDLFCYMNDVVMLNFKSLTTQVSTELVDSLFIPLYVYCVTYEMRSAGTAPASNRSIGMVVALYLLAQMFLIFDYPPMVNTVAAALLLGKPDRGDQCPGDVESLSMGMQQLLVQEDALDKERAVGREERAAAALKQHERLSNNANDARRNADDTDDNGAAADTGDTADGGAGTTADTEAAESRDTGSDGVPVAAQNGEGNDAIVVVDGADDVLPGQPDSNAANTAATTREDGVGLDHDVSVDTSGSAPTRAAAGSAASEDTGDVALDGRAGPVGVTACAVGTATPPENADDDVGREAVSPRPDHDHCSVMEAQGVTADMDEEHAKATALGRLFALLDCRTDDVVTLQAMVLLHAIMANQGTYQRILNDVGLHRPCAGAAQGDYNHDLVSRLLDVIAEGSKYGHAVRIVTLTLACQLVQTLTVCPPEETEEDPGALRIPRNILSPAHLARVEELHDASVAQLAHVYEAPYRAGVDAQQHFLDAFETELKIMKPVKIPLFMGQATVLLMPPRTEIHGMDFEWRLPESDEEHVRKALQIFFTVRKLWLQIHREKEEVLPLRQPPKAIAVRDAIDMTVGDLIACTVVSRGKNRQLVQVRRYLYVDEWRLVLVEPSTTQPGQGTIRFIADLNYVLACPETHNTRALQLVIRQPVYRPMARTALDHREHHVVFSGRLVFDNHIRCVAAQQYLERGRATLRTEKLQLVEQLMGMASPPPRENSADGSDGERSASSPSYLSGSIKNL